jgi:hypothetical protein
MRGEAFHVASLLTAAWALAAQRPPLGEQMRVSPVVEQGLEIFATLASDGRRGLLLLPERRETLLIEAGMRKHGGAALVAEVASFSDSNGTPKQGIHVRCQDHSLDEAFTMFCALVCIRATSGPISPALAASFEEFRSLIGANRARIKPDTIGVIGELLWIDRMVAMDPTAVLSWMGPSGGRHDFRRGRTAVEVKTSLRSGSQANKVRISALDQLVPPEGGKLFLHTVRLERADDGEISLSALIDDIRRRLSGESHRHFNRQLAELGDFGQDVDGSFSVLSIDTFEVRDGFPRLVPGSLLDGSLPAGVASVSYDLLLDFAHEFQVDSDAAATALLKEA